MSELKQCGKFADEWKKLYLNALHDSTCDSHGCNDESKQIPNGRTQLLTNNHLVPTSRIIYVDN